jgi:deoxyribose-phosphate aldolase
VSDAPLNPRQLEQLVKSVTEEILSYLGSSTRAPISCADIDDVVCPGCDQSCVQNCERKARKVISAGADRISAGPTVSQVDASIASLIDHTLLKPDASRDDVKKLCGEAVRFGFASVCINPWYVPLAAELVRGSPVKVCTVVGFPLGATLPQVKVYEAEEVIKLGAQEVDMVINVGAVKSGQDDVVEADVRGVVEAAHRAGAICKVILETALLTIEEKVRASLACKKAGADFVKTSTGFSTGGATAEDVALMRAVVGSQIGVKASGGIRTIEDFKKMVSAGATRIGASASVKILEQARAGDPPGGESVIHGSPPRPGPAPATAY